MSILLSLIELKTHMNSLSFSFSPSHTHIRLVPTFYSTSRKLYHLVIFQ